MLIIRKEQIAAFAEGALRHFEEEMVEHSKTFTPRLCKVLGDAQLRVAIRLAMERAARCGFTNRGPMRLYIECMFLYGSEFATDPLHARLGLILRSPAGQMERAEQIYEYVRGFRAAIAEPDERHVRMALERLVGYLRQPLRLSHDGFVAEMLAAMCAAFPQFLAYTGESPALALIECARAKALTYAFDTLRAQAMAVIMAFVFGKGCFSDPLYPWIANTMNEERTTDAAGRAERLERKLLVWLDHVIDGITTESQHD